MAVRDIDQWHNGNFGAMECIQCISHDKEIISQLNVLKSIRGTNLYVLWSDLSMKDVERMRIILRCVPSSIIEDACNRQDRSGLQLINKYI